MNAKLGIDSCERISVVDDRLRLKKFRLRKELRFFLSFCFLGAAELISVSLEAYDLYFKDLLRTLNT